MTAANFSRDVLENFYGEISHQENQRLRQPIRPNRRLDFEIERNEFKNEGRKATKTSSSFSKKQKTASSMLQGMRFKS